MTQGPKHKSEARAVAGPDDIGPIVSSGHLASGALPALSEFEFALNMAASAFHRWIARCAAAAGQPELSALDVLVLHNVRHRDKPKTLADVCLVLNVEDTHLVNYSLKKLTGFGLIATGRRGKEKTVHASQKGRDVCEAYKAIREQLLVSSMVAMGHDPASLSELARRLRSLSGHYDQAARAAASL